MIAKLRNGSTVTGRLAKIFVSRKVAVWIPEEQDFEDEVDETELDESTENKPENTLDIKPNKAKVLVAKSAKKPVKKAGRPSKKK